MPSQPSVTVGVDLGDRHSHLCLIDTASGEVAEEGRIPTTPKAFERRFSGCERMRVAVEAGTHSPWVSRLLEGCGHEVLVANARRLRLIYAEGRKTDEIDAQKLARLARIDPELLAPLKHRGKSSQAHLALVHSRRGARKHEDEARQPRARDGEVPWASAARLLRQGLPPEGRRAPTGAAQAGARADP
jgi:hypothetical protein